jgi:CDP-paratose 2-epimerase
MEVIFCGLFEDPEHDLDMIIHTAAQPSHDWAAKEPLTDFSVNAIGTMNMLELTRLYAPKASFIFTSTNKVYGDTPNRLGLIELESRFEAVKNISNNQEFPDFQPIEVDENMSIDHTKHSIFGASKVAADVMVQEYGKYFGMNTVCFRGGCLTGPNHAGAELHGFLAYLIKCIVTGKHYNIFGYKGKQVRDNIHSWDLVNMFWHYHQNPIPGAVYNAGGGRENSTSILEAIDSVNRILTEINPLHETWKNYNVLEENRIGDHQWYISDLAAFTKDYPEWPGITISLEETIRQMVQFELSKTAVKPIA